VLCAPEELAHVRGTEKHQVSLAHVLGRAWRPRVLRWMLHAIKAGALAAKPVPGAQPWDAAALRALPGRPVAQTRQGRWPPCRNWREWTPR